MPTHAVYEVVLDASVDFTVGPRTTDQAVIATGTVDSANEMPASETVSRSSRTDVATAVNIDKTTIRSRKTVQQHKLMPEEKQSHISQHPLHRYMPNKVNILASTLLAC